MAPTLRDFLMARNLDLVPPFNLSCKPLTGPLSVYSQHPVEYQGYQMPKNCFFQDLREDVLAALNQKDQVVLMLHGNFTMKDSGLQCTLKGIKMREAIVSKHGEYGPSIFKRNTTRAPVDGI
jgi:hypothetical protein